MDEKRHVTPVAAGTDKFINKFVKKAQDIRERHKTENESKALDEVETPAGEEQDATQLEKKEERQFSVEEIAKHNKADNLWLVIDKKVYDVTAFANDHPGGVDALLGNAGSSEQKVTENFNGVEHSDGAKQKLATFLIGSVAE